MRHRSYESLFIANIRLFPFALFVRANPEGKVYTFDDGLLNLVEEEFQTYVYKERAIRRLIKRLFRVCDSPSIIRKARRHYTIFPERFIVGIRYPIEELDLFGSGVGKTDLASLRKIRVLLGSWFPDNNLQSYHDRIVESGKFDIFLPHPSDLRPPIVAPWIRATGVGFDPVKMIAEEAIITLKTAGYRPVVYGFCSTALVNLARFERTVAIFLTSNDEIIFKQSMFRFGVRGLRCYNYTGLQMPPCFSNVQVLEK